MLEIICEFIPNLIELQVNYDNGKLTGLTNYVPDSLFTH